VIRVLPGLVLASFALILISGSGALAQTTEADVYVAQAILDFDDKRYDAALENLRRALEREPDHLEALYYTGAVYAAQQRPDLATPFLERARAKAPKDTSIGFQLGLVYFAQQQYDKAEPILEEVYRPPPTSTASATTSDSFGTGRRITGARSARSAGADRAIRRSSSSRASTPAWRSASSAYPARRRRRSSRRSVWRRARS